MPTQCCVSYCRSRSHPEEPVPLHRFPQSDHFRDVWRQILEVGPIKLSASRVCGKHFSISQYDNYDAKTLKINTFPDMQLPRTRKVIEVQQNPKRAQKRTHSEYIYYNVRKHRTYIRRQDASYSDDKENTTPVIPQNEPKTSENLRHICTHYSRIQQVMKAETSKRSRSMDSGTDSPSIFSASMFENVGREETVTTENQLKENEYPRSSSNSHGPSEKIGRFIMFKGLFNIDGLTTRHLKHLTGLTKCQFEFVYDLCTDRQTECPYYGLALREQLLCTFIKYRKGWEFLTLAILFKLKESTARDIFVFWTNLLNSRIAAIDFWEFGSRQEDEYIAILDCTEIPMEKPESPDIQQVTFSKYKNTNTFKVLVAIDEQGTILFVSDAYGGSVSDNKIVELSGIIDKLHEGDHILADRGFEQTDILSAKGIILNRPPNKKGEQLSEEDVFRTRAIASRRIDVERMIGYAKTYKILSHKVTHAMFPFMDKIIKVLFKLTNFRPPICKIAKDRVKEDLEL
ncbi:uncharacterized protein LOC110676590 [Aedes aegypti]|uniref:THAP-type domain-containing protein n=1 Tax=Aedes aegypti TaxID=7159 RepID=A0A6I8U1H3_AEDAE|nr:uncharacterized protein LOC110676213 [Aedes aegypti]XP_021700766.1 uncharacterized protein LOC110676590 [Aedes aegypti]